MPPRRRSRSAPTAAAPGWVGIAVVVLVSLWIGPWPLAAGLLLLLAPPVRRAVRAALTPRAGLAVVALLVAAVAASVLLPAGMLPVPSGPGVLVGPSYRGSPVDPPTAGGDGPGSRGPLGDRLGVRTAWYGVSGCHQVLPVTAAGRSALVARCGGAFSSDLRLVDPETLRVRSRLDVLRGASCASCVVDLDGGRLLVLTPRALQTVLVGRRLTSGPTLRTGLPDDDVLAAAGRDGRTVRWVSSAGRTGTIAPDGSRARPGRDVRDVDGATSTVSGHRLLTTTSASGRSRLVVTDLRTARRTCSVGLGAGSAVGTPAVSAGTGGAVVVATDRAVVRVATPGCRVVWRSTSLRPACGPALSAGLGEVYVCERRLDWRGVWAWYVAAVSLRTGGFDVARRTGTGPLAAPRSAVVPAPGRAAFVGLRAGILRVRDGR